MPLSDLVIALVGPGRVGTSLARWAAARGARIAAVAGESREAAERLAGELDARPVAVGALASRGLDLLLIAVPDPVLAAVAELLGERPQAACALHTAGALGAAVLAPLAAGGSRIGTLHPLRAFVGPSTDVDQARGTFFALDGDPEALALGARLAEAWGATAGVVPAASRPLYHLAASLAAGGVTTLVATAAEIARSAGLPPAVVGGYLTLARGALEAAGHERDPSAAITGPVARGEAERFASQLTALRETLPEAVAVVEAVARETLRLRQPADRGGSADGFARLRRLLGDPPRPAGSGRSRTP